MLHKDDLVSSPSLVRKDWLETKCNWSGILPSTSTGLIWWRHSRRLPSCHYHPHLCSKITFPSFLSPPKKAICGLFIFVLPLIFFSLSNQTNSSPLRGTVQSFRNRGRLEGTPCLHNITTYNFNISSMLAFLCISFASLVSITFATKYKIKRKQLARKKILKVHRSSPDMTGHLRIHRTLSARESEM